MRPCASLSVFDCPEAAVRRPFIAPDPGLLQVPQDLVLVVLQPVRRPGLDLDAAELPLVVHAEEVRPALFGRRPARRPRLFIEQRFGLVLRLPRRQSSLDLACRVPSPPQIPDHPVSRRRVLDSSRDPGLHRLTVQLRGLRRMEPHRVRQHAEQFIEV